MGDAAVPRRSRRIEPVGHGDTDPATHQTADHLNQATRTLLLTG